MTKSLARRGPDAEGLESWPGASFGHRRLSIFDLSALGKQPMLSPDREIGVVFNGAIYNFHELRADLEKQGYRFKSQTDTEILIHGYHAWGIDRLVERMRGMFAIGLWDNREGKLFLLRDRLGVKPLVYATDGARLAFGSTVRAVAECGLAGEPDPAAVSEFFEYGYVTDDRAIFKNVRKVPAATLLEFSNGQISQREYWKPSVARPAGSLNFEDAVEETERLLHEAIELHVAGLREDGLPIPEPTSVVH